MRKQIVSLEEMKPLQKYNLHVTFKDGICTCLCLKKLLLAQSLSAETAIEQTCMQFSFEPRLNTSQIKASVDLPIIIVTTIYVHISHLAQLQGHLLSWHNLIIPTKTVFILSVITVIWEKVLPLIVYSDTVFM